MLTFALNFVVNICELPHTEGTVQCRAAKPRFYFNKDAKKCQFFNYGGCGATANNFKAIEECQKACPGDVEQQTDEKVKPTLESSPAT